MLNQEPHIGNTITAPLFTVAQNVARTMSSREIAELTGKAHPKVTNDIGVMLFELNIDAADHRRIYVDAMNRQQTEFVLDRELTDCLLTGYSPVMRMAVIKRWRELEAQVATPIALPSYAEALRGLADQIEETARVTVERDAAIATKALIGSKREAVAMNTASQAVKKANGLERELGRAKDYCTVKRMSMIHHGQPFDWRTLRSAGNEMGVGSIDVFDQNYGTVKAYHSSVWREVYGVDVGGAE